jgi:hypothetical protein
LSVIFPVRSNFITSTSCSPIDAYGFFAASVASARAAEP